MQSKAQLTPEQQESAFTLILRKKENLLCADCNSK